MVKFSSRIFVLGINPILNPPDRILRSIFKEAGKDKGPIPVRGRLNGAEFIQTLVKYQGGWRLYINGKMLKESGLAVGSRADIEIEFDPKPRKVPMPAELAKALKADRKAKTTFNQLAPSRRKEILRYIGSLKSAASIERNVSRLIAQLSGDVGDPPVFMRKK